MNSFGFCLRLTSFGESHGAAIGGIIDGFPAGFSIDRKKVQQALDARRPGQSPLTSARREPDEAIFLSGIHPDGRSLGTPISFIIKNNDTRSADYDTLENVFRPNHADFTYEARYGIRDHRGGGRASARETANWVVAGEIARQLIESFGVYISSSLIAVGGVSDPALFQKMILEAKENGESIGGLVETVISGLPAGVGDPVFNKLDARLAFAALTVNGAKGIEFGDGFRIADMTGSETADLFSTDNNGRIITLSNHCGGIQGGISNGMPVSFRIPFKPTPSISKPLQTVDRDGNSVLLRSQGRHDPCIALRAVPVVKAVTALTIADMMIADGLIPLKSPFDNESMVH